MKCKKKCGRHFLVLALLVQSAFSFAQSKPFTLNSGEVIGKGIEMHDKQNYKGAIAEYQKVPENDTNFVLAMYELAVSARADSQLTLAKSAINRALEYLPSPYEHDLYTQMGSVYDEENKLDSGLIYFNRAIQKFPNSSYAYHAKGINLTIAKNYDSAIWYFQKAILINPYSENSHYFLGLIANEKGYPIQAMMSYGLCLMISPEGGRSSACLAALHSLANLTDKVLENYTNRKEERWFKEDYSELETFYKAKIALDKSYKIQSDIDDNIFRQLNLLCEKLPSKPSAEGNLWESYYAPIYKELYLNKYFNAACIWLVSGIDNDAIRKKVNSEKKDIQKFSEWLANQLNDIGYHRSAVKPVDKTKPGYYFDKGYAIAKGKMLSAADQKVTGEWEYYNKTGQVISRRNYVAGKLNGLYENFYYDGTRQFSGMVANDKSKGETIYYYENGLMQSKGNYDDEKKLNEYIKYFSNGNIKEIENYKNGILDGKTITYYNSGGKRYEGSYQNGVLEGQFMEYYSNGRLSSVSEVKKGKANGLKTEYYKSGKLYSKVNLKDGNRDGEYTSWYENGQVETKENYKNGKLEGKCSYYHKNGKLRTEVTYDGGVQEGGSTTFDPEARIHFKDEYKKGHLAKIAHFNVLNNSLVKQDLIEDRDKNLIHIYNTIGVLEKEAVCDRDGNFNGSHKEYHLNGAVKMERNYVKGTVTGASTGYFANGKVERKMNYKDGELDGEFVSYYDNGKIAREGNYSNGEQQGYWYNYDNIGNLLGVEYLIDGKYNGISTYYRPNGKLQKKEKWAYDELLSITLYDTAGKMIKQLDYPAGKTTQASYYNALGKKVREYTFVNNYIQGKLTGYYPNGAVEHTIWYKNGNQDSVYTSYHTNGKVYTEGMLLDDDKHGAWKTYDRNGHLVSTEYYEYGEEEGIDTMYSSKGTIETIIPHVGGERSGWVSKFALSGDLVYKLHYIEDLLVGYTYQSKTGDLVPEVAVENGQNPVAIKTYFKDGKVSADFTYHHGKFDGKRTFYQTNGKVFYEINLDKGAANGSEKEYYENGQVYTNRIYSHGELEGLQQVFNENGKISMEEMYVNGYRHGPSRYYDGNGKLSQTVTYYWGEILDVQ